MVFLLDMVLPQIRLLNPFMQAFYFITMLVWCQLLTNVTGSSMEEDESSPLSVSHTIALSKQQLTEASTNTFNLPVNRQEQNYDFSRGAYCNLQMDTIYKIFRHFLILTNTGLWMFTSVFAGISIGLLSLTKPVDMRGHLFNHYPSHCFHYFLHFIFWFTNSRCNVLL